MKHLLTCAVMAIWLASSARAGSADQVRVRAVVNSETAIYPGDVFQYSVVVEGGGKPSKIDISPLAQFNPRSAGDGSSFQQFNDQIVVSYSSNYAIVAREAGTMHLPGVKVVVGGRTYTTNAVDVIVSKPGTTDRMTVEFTVSKQKCYAGEPVVLTVKWVVLARVEGGFNVEVPVFSSDDFLFEDVSGVAVGPDPQRPSIHGVPITLMQERGSVRGMAATTLSFTKILIAKRPGPVQLDPITVSANVAVGRVRTNSIFEPYALKFERVSVQSDPIELEVLPLPEAGKPAAFYGLVGRYTIAASAAPTKVSVGDPITLTIRIGGNPYLKPVQWPQLEAVPGLVTNFKIPSEKASPTLDDGFKVFTQTIRANDDAVTQVPPIPLAYFDSDRGQYVEARTEPIPLEVAPTKMLTNADMEGLISSPVNREVEAIRKGLSANYYGVDVLVDQRFSLLSAVFSPGYAAIWSIPLVGLVASTVLRLACRTSPEALARKRRRQAAATAVRRVKALTSAEPCRRPELLLGALRDYIGDRFDRRAASLTADDCRQAIAEATEDSDAATQYGDLIATCEAARYAPLVTEIGSSHVHEATALIDAIERRLKR